MSWIGQQNVELSKSMRVLLYMWDLWMTEVELCIFEPFDWTLLPRIYVHNNKGSHTFEPEGLRSCLYVDHAAHAFISSMF